MLNFLDALKIPEKNIFQGRFGFGMQSRIKTAYGKL